MASNNTINIIPYIHTSNAKYYLNNFFHNCKTSLAGLQTMNVIYLNFVMMQFNQHLIISVNCVIKIGINQIMKHATGKRYIIY
ncbi:hypothetical protein HZS_7022 [Henneguya salminicola]|nr:hypothetical protein HZS_7022 [Henneguya salminicola]